MKIPYVCPSCLHEGGADASFVGKRVKCPACKQPFVFEQDLRDSTPAVPAQPTVIRTKPRRVVVPLSCQFLEVLGWIWILTSSLVAAFTAWCIYIVVANFGKVPAADAAFFVIGIPSFSMGVLLGMTVGVCLLTAKRFYLDYLRANAEQGGSDV